MAQIPSGWPVSLGHSAQTALATYHRAKNLEAAEQQRRVFGSCLNQLLAAWDILICPTIQSLPERVDAAPPEPCFTTMFNASRHPALSFPCGLSSAGLPIGVQIVAAHDRDGLLLCAAAAYEASYGFSNLTIDPLPTT